MRLIYTNENSAGNQKSISSFSLPSKKNTERRQRAKTREPMHVSLFRSQSIAERYSSSQESMLAKI